MNGEKEIFLREFGQRVKNARKNKDLTLEELANKMGYISENERSSVQKIETGKSDLPASKIRKLADILEVSVGYLMGFDD